MPKQAPIVVPLIASIVQSDENEKTRKSFKIGSEEHRRDARTLAKLAMTRSHSDESRLFHVALSVEMCIASSALLFRSIIGQVRVRICVSYQHMGPLLLSGEFNSIIVTQRCVAATQAEEVPKPKRIRETFLYTSIQPSFFMILEIEKLSYSFLP
ncbi:MAG TPA: hypothetical protein VGO47_05685 [Chlamydiales bacterium]|nr:hypothetical protein [Chlamydiales bacterium]